MVLMGVVVVPVPCAYHRLSAFLIQRVFQALSIIRCTELAELCNWTVVTVVSDPTPGDIDPPPPCLILGDIVAIVGLGLPRHDEEVAMCQANLCVMTWCVYREEAKLSIPAHGERQNEDGVPMAPEEWFIICVRRQAPIMACIEINLAAGGEVLRRLWWKVLFRAGVSVHDERWHGQWGEVIPCIPACAFAGRSDCPSHRVLTATCYTRVTVRS